MLLPVFKRDRDMTRDRKGWTKEETEALIRLYPTHFAREIAVILGKTKSSVYGQVYRLGLKSPQEKIRRAGMITASSPRFVAAQFKKGQTSYNKGKKMPPEVYAKVQPTMFKKGQVAHNHKPVGSERVNTDGYVEVKVAEPSTWRPKHRIIWEQAHGQIPKGHKVQFVNGNPLDCRLENLYLISNAEQMRTQNSFLAKYPKPLQDVIRLKGCINRQIHQREKQNGEQ